MANKKTYTIGLIIPDISNPFYAEVLKWVQEKAISLGYSVVYNDTDNNPDREMEAIKLLNSKSVDGIILSLSLNNKNLLYSLEKKGFPIVQIDNRIPESKSYVVMIDNVTSAYNATKYLIILGHKKIVHITGNLNTRTGQERLIAFKKALKEHDLEPESEWMFKGDYFRKSGYEQMRILLNMIEKPITVFAANDIMSIGCYEAVFEKGLSVPDDISIVSHDDIYISSILRPGLIIIVQPKTEIGRKAADVLIKKIEGSVSFGSCSIFSEIKLKIRGFTRKI